MKRLKFMLLSLALVAVVGGALAFKAKSGNHFCTTLAQKFGGEVFTCIDPNLGNPRPLKCPTYISQWTTSGNEGDFVCTTTDDGEGACASGILDCLSTTYQTIQQD